MEPFEPPGSAPEMHIKPNFWSAANIFFLKISPVLIFSLKFFGPHADSVFNQYSSPLSKIPIYSISVVVQG